MWLRVLLEDTREIQQGVCGAEEEEMLSVVNTFDGGELVIERNDCSDHCIQKKSHTHIKPY